MPQDTSHKVSIIVPVLNGGPYIAGLADAILTQQYPDYEVCFVVDSRTEDDTVERIEESIPRLMSARYVMNDGAGLLGISRNIALDITDGGIVWFLDVDDLPYPDFLRSMVATMDATDADVVLCNYVISDRKEIPVIERDFSVRVMNSGEALEQRCQERIPVTSWAKIQTRALLDDNGIRFGDGLCEDIEFTYKELACAGRVAYDERPHYLYYRHEGSVCSTEDDARGIAEVEAYGRLMGYIEGESPAFYPSFRARAAITAMRSMVHMSYPVFKEQRGSNWVLPLINELGIRRPRPEVFIFRHSAWAYYRVASFLMRHYYYRMGMLFDESAGRRRDLLADRHFRRFRYARGGIPRTTGSIRRRSRRGGSRPRTDPSRRFASLPSGPLMSTFQPSPGRGPSTGRPPSARQLDLFSKHRGTNPADVSPDHRSPLGDRPKRIPGITPRASL